MRIVIFGLAISSAWGNGHATLWRALCRALHGLGHEATFFERDVPYYAQHRDMTGADWCALRLYEDWPAVRDYAQRELANADVAIVTSYCPDSVAASRLVLDSGVPRRVFYDLDSPVTVDRLARGETVPYLPPEGLGDFDLVLSYGGGGTLEALRRATGARSVLPLYGSVDPDVHRPVPAVPEFSSALSYLGTYAMDRQTAVDRFFLAPARLRPDLTFALAGSQYPVELEMPPNVRYSWHMPPPAHPAFYCSSAFTLNVTREPMAVLGHCPSGRLFEAAACGVPVVSDWWVGLDAFFEPAQEIVIVHDTADVLKALDLPEGERRRIARAARERALDCHSAMVRARELEALLESTWCGGMEVA
jgi:spore maturation protein CgeB